MKKIKLFLFLIICFCIHSIDAQNLELVSGKKHKTIKAGTYLNIGIKEPGQDDCDKCAGKYIQGRFISYADSTLTMQVNRIDDRPEGDTILHYYTQQVFSKHYELPMMEFNKEDISTIVIKGKLKARKYSTGETIGHVISAIGFGHLVSAPIVGEDDAGLLIGLGLAELFGGLIISGMADQPSYVLKPEFLTRKQTAAKLWIIK